MVKTSKAYLHAWDDEDLEGLQSVLDDDFLNMYNYDMVMDVEACREGFREFFDDVTIIVNTYEQQECFADQNYVFEITQLEQRWIREEQGDTVYDRRRGLSVWKKQEDGSWKLYRGLTQE